MIILKRTQNSSYFITDMGITIPAEDSLTVDPSQYIYMHRSSDLITALSNSDLIINDGHTDLLDLSEATRLVLGGTPSVNISSEPPFASKNIGPKKIFTRVTGKIFTVIQGSTDCLFSIPYNEMKIDGIEVIGGEIGDYVDLYVLDTPSGTISTIPNYSLNQFGFTCNVSKDYYLRQSKYDADLIKDLQIKTVYNSVSAKTIYINYLIHELK